MKGRVLVLGVIGLLVVGVAIGGRAALRRERARQGARPKNAPLAVTTKAKQEDLLITVAQTGAVAAKNATPVIPEISGRAAWVCENGIVVKAGDPILRLDPRKLQEQLNDLTVRYQEAQLRQTQAETVQKSRMTEMRLRLKQAEDGVASYERQQQIALRQAADQIEFDRKELEKRRQEAAVKQRLAEKGLIPETEVEREDAAIKAQEFSIQKAASDLELKKSQVAAETVQRRQNVNNTNRDMSRARSWTERDVRMSGNEVENLKLQLGRAKEDMGRTVLPAPAAGLVMLSNMSGWVGDSHPPRVGDYISQGREAAQIIDLGRMQVKIELDQTQITGVRMSQEAEVTVDALPGQVLKGKITAIGQNARHAPVQGWFGNSSTATFPVTIDLPPTGKALIRPGMRANVRVVSRTIKNAILVPAGCVFTYGGKPVVYVDHGGSFVRTPVTVGESNGDYIAIASGLSAGQRIALNDLGASAAGSAPIEQSQPKERRSR